MTASPLFTWTRILIQQFNSKAKDVQKNLTVATSIHLPNNNHKSPKPNVNCSGQPSLKITFFYPATWPFPISISFPFPLPISWLPIRNIAALWIIQYGEHGRKKRHCGWETEQTGIPWVTVPEWCQRWAFAFGQSNLSQQADFQLCCKIVSWWAWLWTFQFFWRHILFFFLLLPILHAHNIF